MVVASCTAATCERSRDGITWSSLDRAAQRGLADAGHAATGGDPQADGHGDGLLGVEQQRRQGRAGAELVAAAVALAGVHGIAEVAQAFDVAAHAASRHPEAFGEFFAAPHPARLQQAEKLQHPARRFGHPRSLP